MPHHTPATIDFEAFCAEVFQSENPATVLSYNWHLQMLAGALEEARHSEIKRLIINMPPRSLKSQYISVAWPAWLLGRNPSTRIMVACYSQKLSEKHSTDCRHMIESDLYQAHFPATQLTSDQNQKNKFMTTSRGYRIATSVGGTATGEGGNFLIVDDPHNPNHIHSPKRRKGVIEWFEQTWMSRLDDKEDGSVILVMQRLHEDDLAGYLLAKPHSPWHQLTLPAIANEAHTIFLPGLSYPRAAGELLHPQRGGKVLLEQLKREMGAHNFSAQYQQMPLSTEGNMIERGWIQLQPADDRGDPGRCYDQIIQSWDTATQTTQTSDYSVCSSWGILPNRYILLDVFRAKLPFTALIAKVKALAAAYQPHCILIENKGSGQIILQNLRAETHLPVVPITPTIDKVSRLMSVAPLFEAGKVRMVEAGWTPLFLEELLTFPFGKHDDQVDSVTQCLNYVQADARKRPPSVSSI